MEREKFGSRLGFILISAACAVGLGNVWRFPYVVGQYGGGAFVIIYLVFLVLVGVPIMAMELAVGRASQASVATSFHKLPSKKSFRWFSIPAAAGSYILMMFYTTICGWLLYYLFKMPMGGFVGKTPDEVGAIFGELTQNPMMMTICMIAVTIGCFFIVGIGLQEGVERVTKFMMICLFALIMILAVRCMMLPNAMEGLKFYIVPDFAKVNEIGWGATAYAALAQAAFTLSIGIGSMQIFGSYLKRERRLLGEAVMITTLDTVSAYIAGLIIFPACFAFGVEPNSGPGLVFVTLPNIFNEMSGGLIWGTLFFIFLFFAGIATTIAVFENIIAVCQEWFGWSRKKSAIVNAVVLIVLAMPCVLGFNAWANFQPLGPGTNVLDLEDFFLSNNLLPIGSLVYVIYCCTKYGWGWDNFIKEVNAGDAGMAWPKWKWLRPFFAYVLPVIIVIIFIVGYIEIFSK